MGRCEACPVAKDRVCLGDAHPDVFPHLCRWARSDDPNERAMPVIRSEVGYTPPGPPTTPTARQGPGLLARAVSFTKAAAAHVAAGMPAADEATFAARLAICRACPTYRPESKTCGACGCGELKLRWLTSACPEGKW